MSLLLLLSAILGEVEGVGGCVGLDVHAGRGLDSPWVHEGNREQRWDLCGQSVSAAQVRRKLLHLNLNNGLSNLKNNRHVTGASLGASGRCQIGTRAGTPTAEWPRSCPSLILSGFFLR
jgi:hypothetical protein